MNDAFLKWDQCRPVPGTSYVVMTDVKGSTAAVREGRYRDVNLLGASSIAAIRNEFPDLSIPYVFGGDGATFIVPQEYLLRCREVLGRVQKVALTEMKLELRVGHVSVGEIAQQGGEVRVGFKSVGGREGFYYFRGSGLAIAESLIKSRQSFVCDPANDDSKAANLEGLSCRVQPFPSRRGTIACVLVEPRCQGTEQDELLDQILFVMSPGGELRNASPLSMQTLHRKWLPSTWLSEARLQAAGLSGFARLARIGRILAETLVGNVCFALNIRNPVLGSPQQYERDMMTQSDWIKMDGGLKFVADLELGELARLSALLERLYADGKIFFGIEQCKSAVLTCHLMAREAFQPQHTHFVDGSSGGLSAAATKLKAQKRQG
ncbi:MAG: DUF3095 family protein [Oligoflexia bacterium]